MMKSKIFLLTMLFVVGFSFQNCSLFTGCECPPIQGQYFDIQGLKVSNSGKDGAPIVDHAEVKFSDYTGLSINYEVAYHSYLNAHDHDWSFSLINSAMACECAFSGQAGSKDEQLAGLTIITLNDFNDEYKANDTISELWSRGTIPLSEFVAQDTNLIREENLFIHLDEAPTSGEELKVKVIVELSTNEVYEAESQSVKIIE